VYSIIPLAAILAYLPLLVTTITIRPLKRTRVLFTIFLIAAITWSLVDYVFRANLFPEYSFLLLKLILVSYAWMTAQFHVFVSSFFPPGIRRWRGLAWVMLVSVVLMVSLNFLAQGVIVDGERLYPQYGPGVAVMAAMLLTLVARNLYVFWHKLRTSNNPVLSNQIFSLRLALIIITVFSIAALLPWAREYPVSHLGNMINAVVLSYAAVGHQLVDIRIILQRGLTWAIMVAVGVFTYLLLILVLYAVLHLVMDVTTIFIVTFVVVGVLALVFRLRHFLYNTTGKVFHGASYDYRQLLKEFANSIQNIFSLHRQGGELLYLIAQAVNCNHAGLLFLNPGGQYYTMQIYYPQDEDNPLARLKLLTDSPIVTHLSRERHALTSSNLATMPEFQALWEEEKEIIHRCGIELFLPLISRDKLIGILVTDNRRSGYYSLEDHILLEQVTSHVSASIEKEYLREQLTEYENELRVINRSSTILTSSLDIRQVFDDFIQELRGIMKIDWAAIFEIQGDEAIALAISSGSHTEWQVGNRGKLADSPLKWMADQRNTIISGDITSEWRFKLPQWRFSQEIHSAMCLPLVLKDTVTGALVLGGGDRDAYGAYHADVLAQLTTQVATALENSRLYTEAERLARIDKLTGLLNRRALDETLETEIARHMRYDSAFSVIIIDLDSFKLYNDRHGHLAGDLFLQQAGQVIKNSIRRSDHAFRYGGDEFAILLPQTTGAAANEVVERIHRGIAKNVDAKSDTVTSSLGLATWPVHGVYINQILNAADRALYLAKHKGGDQYCNASEQDIGRENTILQVIESLDKVDSGRGLDILFALAVMVDSRNPLDGGHSRRVTEYSVALAETLGLPGIQREKIKVSARLHDIGKYSIDTGILHKPGPLDAEEWEAVKKHPKVGADVLSRVDYLASYIPGILYHHEHYDGSGYPHGLSGDAIPLEARIISLADAFTAMTSERSYSVTLSEDAALGEICNCAGTQFDPELTTVFVKMIKGNTTTYSVVRPTLISNVIDGGNS
jgi:diguanylate cyclase (GGDEF)-like protein